MDRFREVFDLYAEQFAKIPMFPVLQCVHYTIMNLKLRMAEGTYMKGALHMPAYIYVCHHETG